MKIRIKGNSVRYRLTKSEVGALAEKGVLEENTDFLSASMVYAIKQADVDQLKADFIENKITLYIPAPILQKWAATEQIGMEYDMPLPGGGSLYLLVEKDFKCIDADLSEDQSDFFENPNLNC
ncbi:MAG: hypothetical protein ABWZ79_12595 [Pedobacter agri]